MPRTPGSAGSNRSRVEPQRRPALVTVTSWDAHCEKTTGPPCSRTNVGGLAAIPACIGEKRQSAVTKLANRLQTLVPNLPSRLACDGCSDDAGRGRQAGTAPRHLRLLGQEQAGSPVDGAVTQGAPASPGHTDPIRHRHLAGGTGRRCADRTSDHRPHSGRLRFHQRVRRGGRRALAARTLAVGIPAGSGAPLPNLALSNLGRAALAGYLKTLAAEVHADGVTVNLLLPGWTRRTGQQRSPMGDRSGRSVDDVRSTPHSPRPAVTAIRLSWAAWPASCAASRSSYVTRYRAALRRQWVRSL